MKMSKPVMVLAVVAPIALGLAFALLQSGYLHRPRAVVFAPPYPEVNASGDPILVDFGGRIPCHVANCERLKLELVLYHDLKDRSPTSYWLGLVGTHGNDRVVMQGKWTIRQGVEKYPDAMVYALDSKAPAELRYYWLVNDNILLPLDQTMSPKVGNGAWGYMLSRINEPYGPRTYVMQ
jgi:hypothetical protein